MTQFIAERRLPYSLKGSDNKKEFTIGIGAPTYSDEYGGGYECHRKIEGIEGLNETYAPAFGADSMQAIQFASDIDFLLKRLQKTYELYYLTGEPYFEKA